MPAVTPRQRVVVVGGGFGGLLTVSSLAGANAEITLIDRHNYHLFQPLCYQVATGAISPGEIAVPLRSVFRRRQEVRVLMGEVEGFDLDAGEVIVGPAIAGTAARRIPYDTLVVAGGSSYAYFGHDEWRTLALEVKSLDSALQVRGRILQAFEAAELEEDPERRLGWLTFVVVGAGPTGVEMAGQIAEMARDTLPAEFRSSDPRTGSVLLVEMADRVLTGFAPSLSSRAAGALQQLGVTLMLGHQMVDVHPDRVELQTTTGDRVQIKTRTVVWAAGVTASPLAAALGQAAGAEIDRAGRLLVEPDLTLPGHPEVFALGDMVQVRDPHSDRPHPLPGLAPVAMQQGRYVGALISARLKGSSLPPFHYRDKGSLATIGRGHAVAEVRGLRLSGVIAWVTWLLVHIFYLIGFENRVLVLLRWSYSFFTKGRSTRLITEAAGLPPWHPESVHLSGTQAGSGAPEHTAR
ncbi:MAG TPA: NAD(P)/FAD-dependent oxidoreductase [Solirubrobacteraceae bacterium]|jgi:NADH dehydrogenase|nr:NAD(P)/FAD-dependent oxidoreductase [Solirubrobacteraceae bacterium]